MRISAVVGMNGSSEPQSASVDEVVLIVSYDATDDVGRFGTSSRPLRMSAVKNDCILDAKLSVNDCTNKGTHYR